MMELDVGESVLMEVEDLETSVMRAHLALQQFIRERKRDKEFDVDELPVGGVVSLSFSLLPEVRRQLKVVRNWLRNSQTIVKMELEEVDNYSAFVGPEEGEMSVENDVYYVDKDPLMGVIEEEGGSDGQVSYSNYTGITPKGKRRRHSRKQNPNGNSSTLSGSGTSEGEDVEDDQVELKPKATGLKRRDPIWKEFVLIGDCTWKCKFCDYQLKQPKAGRLREHVYKKCESRPPRLNTDAIGLEATEESTNIIQNIPTPNTSKAKVEIQPEDSEFVYVWKKRPNYTPSIIGSCEKCGKIFKHSTDKARHFERPPCGVRVEYKCPNCNKVLSRKDKLNAHMKKCCTPKDDDDHS